MRYILCKETYILYKTIQSSEGLPLSYTLDHAITFPELVRGVTDKLGTTRRDRCMNRSKLMS